MRSSLAARRASAVPSWSGFWIPALRSRSGIAIPSLLKKPPHDLKDRGRIAAIAVDVTKLFRVERAKDDTLEALGGIDILVNNAGMAGSQREDVGITIEEWRRSSPSI